MLKEQDIQETLTLSKLALSRKFPALFHFNVSTKSLCPANDVTKFPWE